MSAPLLGDYIDADKIDSSKIFRIQPRNLEKLFTPKYHEMPLDLGKVRLSLNLLREFGYAEGVCDSLNTSIGKGISGDKNDIERRKQHFGAHVLAKPEFDGFGTLLCLNFSEQNHLILGATTYLLITIFSGVPDYLGALAIYGSVLFNCGIKAICDHKKQ